MRTALSLKNFQPIYIEKEKIEENDEKKWPEAIFFEGVDLSIFVLSVAHKTNDITARYFVLLHSCNLLMKDSALKEMAGEISPIFGLYQY